MTVTVRNEQRDAPVNVARMAQLARHAVRRLRIRARGTLTITFIDARRMRALNQRFLHHHRTTDVLSFRYDRESVVGDILISPSAAKDYARANRVKYADDGRPNLASVRLMAIHTADAIILRCYPYRETSVIVTCLTGRFEAER